MVVAATGRRGDIPAWLAPLGVEIDETEEDTGIVYLSRFYRLRARAPSHRRKSDRSAATSAT